MDCSLQNITLLFQKMTSNGWDTALPMKWGFFFYNDDKTKLLDVFNELKDSGYQLENIYQDESGDHWTLYVSKIDTLTPEKLHRRNMAFNDLAAYCSVNLYDGWDVEQIN